MTRGQMIDQAVRKCTSAQTRKRILDAWTRGCEILRENFPFSKDMQEAFAAHDWNRFDELRGGRNDWANPAWFVPGYTVENAFRDFPRRLAAIRREYRRLASVNV